MNFKEREPGPPGGPAGDAIRRITTCRRLYPKGGRGSPRDGVLRPVHFEVHPGEINPFKTVEAESLECGQPTATTAKSSITRLSDHGLKTHCFEPLDEFFYFFFGALKTPVRFFPRRIKNLAGSNVSFNRWTAGLG